jgi:hypothetical protein
MAATRIWASFQKLDFAHGQFRCELYVAGVSRCLCEGSHSPKAAPARSRLQTLDPHVSGCSEHAVALPAIRHEADACKAKDEHRPGRAFAHGRDLRTMAEAVRFR